jgi:YD repeat-containing protein
MPAKNKYIKKIIIMKKLMFLSLAFSLVFTSCKKNKDDIEPAHQNLLVKRTDNDGLIFAYTYDASNKMTGYTQTSNAYNPAKNFTFTYNSDGSLATYFESNSSLRGKCTYNTDGTLANKKEYSVAGAVETLVNTYTYTYAAGVTTQAYVYAATGNGFRDEYKYDAKGNVIEQKEYSNTTPGNPTGTYSVTITNTNYDNQNNPNSCYPSSFIFPRVAKNNTGILTYNPGGTGTFIYEYNADGYPTKRTQSTEISVYEYRRL